VFICACCDQFVRTRLLATYAGIRMLAYKEADVCWHTLTYAGIQSFFLFALASSRRMLAYADVCCSMLTCADVCADVCSRMPTERSLLALASCRAYVSIRQHTSAYVGACTLRAACSHSPPRCSTTSNQFLYFSTSKANNAASASVYNFSSTSKASTLVLVNLVKWGAPRAPQSNNAASASVYNFSSTSKASKASNTITSRGLRAVAHPQCP